MFFRRNERETKREAAQNLSWFAQMDARFLGQEAGCFSWESTLFHPTAIDIFRMAGYNIIVGAMPKKG